MGGEIETRHKGPLINLIRDNWPVECLGVQVDDLDAEKALEYLSPVLMERLQEGSGFSINNVDVELMNGKIVADFPEDQ